MQQPLLQLLIWTDVVSCANLFSSFRPAMKELVHLCLSNGMTLVTFGLTVNMRAAVIGSVSPDYLKLLSQFIVEFAMQN